MEKISIAVAVLSIAGVSFGQGSLTPPGAPAPSMKTLDQVEPRIDVVTLAGDLGVQYKIRQSGSYYLSDNLIVSNSIGISIGASDVTLDLNGFRITHADEQEGKAIYVSVIRNVTIKNGNISEFEDGIYMYGSDGLYPTRGARLENLNISRCTGYGLFVGSMSKVKNCHFAEVRGAAAVFAAANSSIENCTANNSSGGYGFHLLAGAKVKNCTAKGSGGTGFNTGSNSVLQACTATQNAGNGIASGVNSCLHSCVASGNYGTAGISCGDSSVLTDCIVFNSQKGIYGISAGTSSSLSGCTASDNQITFVGIFASGGSTLNNCTANNNLGSFGIYTGVGSKLNGCTAFDNKGTCGICADPGTIVENCTATYNSTTNSSGNGGVGIMARSGSTVRGCTTKSNKGDGIQVDHDCIVTGNECDENGAYGDAAGIHATGGDNRIENNNVTDNDRGIEVDVDGNFIIRNTASGNTTAFSITGTQTIGPIITATGTITTTNPWANFSF